VVELWHGDCLEIFPYIEDSSVDLIAADNPYGVSGCKWDSVIPVDDLWYHYMRVIRKPSGVIVLNCTQPFATSLINGNPDWFKYCRYWIKNNTTGFSHCANMPMRDIEEIAVFSPGSIQHANLTNRRMTYNPQGLVRVDRPNRRSSMGFEGSMRRTSKSNTYPTEFTNYPRMTMYYDVETGLHPTQKPEGLIEDIILTYSNEGDTVVDNAMGSGTTGVACVKNNRNFIGMEIEKNYFDIAVKRIEGAMC